MKKLSVYISLIVILVIFTSCGASGTVAAPDFAATPEITAEPTPAVTASPMPSSTPKPSGTPPPTSTPTPEPKPSVAPDSPWTGAKYLAVEAVCDTPTGEQADAFVAKALSLVQSFATLEDGAEALKPAFESLIYDLNPGGVFLQECALASWLTSTGTLVSTVNLDSLYSYLVNDNRFGQTPLAAFDAAKGDIIFWKDADGDISNAGIVCSAEEDCLNVVICGWDRVVVSCQLNADVLSERCLANGYIVHIIYPGMEYVVYSYCQSDLGFSKAAACGVIANIYNESRFNTDIGKGMYGLCQWTNDRLDGLRSYCKTYGLDSSTLYGQLRYVKYELSTPKFTELNDIMLSYGDSEEEAGMAGRQWCWKYEQPADTDTLGRIRGQFAIDYYHLYAE